MVSARIRACPIRGRPAADAKRSTWRCGRMRVTAFDGERRETLYVVDSWARLGLAEVAVAARDYDEACSSAHERGFPGRLPPEFGRGEKR